MLIRVHYRIGSTYLYDQLHLCIRCSMCRAAEAPGKLLRLKKIAPTDATYRPQPTFGEAASSAAAWVWQQLGQMALHAVSWGAVKWLLQSWGSSRHAACAKKVWSLQELGLAAEIACGRTGHVYEGRINGKHVAVKVCSPAFSALGDELDFFSCGCTFASHAVPCKV